MTDDRTVKTAIGDDRVWTLDERGREFVSAYRGTGSVRPEHTEHPNHCRGHADHP